MMRKSVDLVFGKDQVTITGNIKNAPSFLNQLYVHVLLRSQKFRQTDGFGFVVSNPTIGNGNMLHNVDSSLYLNARKPNLQPIPGQVKSPVKSPVG